MRKAGRIDFSQYGYILIVAVIEDYDHTGFSHKVAKSRKKRINRPDITLNAMHLAAIV